MKQILIFGSTGAIGNALVTQYVQRYPNATIHAVSRSGSAPTGSESFANVVIHSLDFSDEASIESLAEKLAKTLTTSQANHAKFDAIIVAIGTLHDGDIQPEKSMSQLSFTQFEQVFAVNTFIPAMLAKHFTPLLNKGKKSVFAVLSARVGSISDNRLGGWYAYRAAKAALNMLIKTASIELARRNKQAIVVGLHPGTVDSLLSKPFQGNVPEGKLFTPAYAAECLIHVIADLSVEDSGYCFAWDGEKIQP